MQGFWNLDLVLGWLICNLIPGLRAPRILEWQCWHLHQPWQHLVFPSQELVFLIKNLKGQVSDLTGTNHSRCFQSLHDELKTYCHALDFNKPVTLNKLRGVLDEASWGQATEMANWWCYERDSLIPSRAVTPWTYVLLYSSLWPQRLNWKLTNWSADTNKQPSPQTKNADLPVLDANGATGVQEVPMAVAIPAGIQCSMLGTAQNDIHVTSLHQRNQRLNKPC